jgi:hypothetical protein
LQELIAPRNLLFLDQSWNARGSKKDFVVELSTIAGIPTHILTNKWPPSSESVAKRMSWAAHRECTRIEDIAYSLLGIFDLNMPLLYGEEERAFRRLQEEIIRSINDLSIFAWQRSAEATEESRSKKRVFCGLLARSSAGFSSCRDITGEAPSGREMSISSVGVKTNHPIYLYRPSGAENHRYILPLHCIDARRSY